MKVSVFYPEFVKTRFCLLEGKSMENEKKTVVEKTVKSGITFGSALAMVISYTAWHSIGWAIFHGLLSWAYVLYYIIRY
jgi:hypothetical protein